MTEIRDMNKTDLARVMDIESKTFVAPWKESEMLYELEENKFAHLAVILLNNNVVGFYDYWHTFDSATIAQIAIDPIYQRQHLGSLLMEEIIKDARAKKVRTMTLEVRKNNEKAVKLYQKFGFKQTLLKEKYYSNGDDAIYMIKELD